MQRTQYEILLDCFSEIGINLQLRQKLISSQSILYNWNEFVAKKKNVCVLEQICRIALNLRLRQKMKWSQNFFLKKRTEFAAKTENDIVSDCSLQLE